MRSFAVGGAPHRPRRGTLVWAVVFVLFIALLISRSPVSPGQAASPGHATFLNSCGKCHEGFAPDRWSLEERGLKRMDHACLKCHEDFQIHNPQQIHPISCQACHEEHKGRERLFKTSADTCIRCHARLERLKGG
jgi:hypothetical protein